MGLRMATPFKDPKSGIYKLRVRVPADLVKVVGRAEEKLSLRTRDPGEAKAAFVRELANMEARWARLRRGAVTVSHKEAVAIAGEIYREFVAANEDNPGDRTMVLGRVLADAVAARDPGTRVIRAGNPEITQSLLDRLGDQHRARVQQYLAARGEVVDAESFERVLTQVNKAMLQAREHVLRMADGNFRPDPDADRFPVRDIAASTSGTTAESTDRYDLKAIYEAYAAESEQALSTRKKWRAIIATVAKEHPDIRTIDADWCVDWKDRLVKSGLSTRTIQFGHLAALRSTCNWAVTNRRIRTNPVEGIGVKVQPSKKGKMRGYNEEEARLILRLTLGTEWGRISEKHSAARRWVPWICCYTGARVGEIGQLRKEDVKVVDGVPLVWITPEVGTVKSGSPRFVAIHPHLIEQGFLEFVRKSGKGPLFYSPRLRRGGNAENPQYKKVGERLASWLRDNGIDDPRLAPNHAWRHAFKSKARVARMDVGARDYMQGHEPASEAEAYGEFPPDVLRAEIEKIPWVKL